MGRKTQRQKGHREIERVTEKERQGHKDTKAETQSWQKRPATGTKKQSKGQKERGQGQSTPEKNHRVRERRRRRQKGRQRQRGGGNVQQWR